MYMSPEQAQGATLDHRTDLFSLGSVLYQMAAGQPPFRGNAPLVVLKQVAEDRPPPIRDIIPETPQWLCDFISKLHAKNPDDRFQSAQEVADLLADCEAKLKAKPDGKDLFPAGKPTAPSRWKLWAGAAVLLPLLALGLTEALGITHLFRGARPATDANQPGDAPAPIQTAKQGSPEGKDWVQLFNGADLTGWKTHPDQPGNWKVENGVLVASGPPLSHLISDRGDYRDFHIRLEANVSNIGDSGLYFRADSGALQPSPVSGLKYPRGYEAQILGPGITNDNPTGSVIGAASVKVAPPSKISTDTWFTLEVIARGNHLTVRVNNRVTADFLDDRNTFRQGRFALQCAGGVRPTRIQIRKIEIRESTTN
jgi:Domain of Unknown Function (DUF1080)/Protein kinase domain